MKRCDAAIIGAGPEGPDRRGHACPRRARCRRAGKNPAPGGRAATREFHPGFRASPFADELPAIPPRLIRSLDLARNGAVLVPSEVSVCISESGCHVLFADPARAARAAPAAVRDGLAGLAGDIAAARESIAARAASFPPPRSRWWLAPWRREASQPWPAAEWGQASLDERLRARIADPDLRLHLASDAVSGRAVSPFLAGSALHLLAPGTGRSGAAAGGLGSLGAALAATTLSAGVTLICNAEVTDIEIKKGHATGLALAGGEVIKARYILSTLDVKRTFLSLVAWAELPRDMLKRIGQCRLAGTAARICFALDAPPVFAFGNEAGGMMPGPIHIVETMEALSQAHDFWRAGVIPLSPLVTLRVPSAADPRLAPVGKAVMTATLSAIPAHLFDGPWDEAKLSRLKEIALAAAERAFPGVSGRVLAAHVVTVGEIETALGSTMGDLDGGELAPDQALAQRPFRDWSDGRTSIAGLYLGGQSSAPAPFFCGLAGERAAHAILADAGKVTGRP